MLHPFFVLVLLAAVAGAAIWYHTVPAPQRKQARNRLLLWGGLGFLGLLLITGRLHPLFAVLAALIPVVQRLLTLAQVANTIKSFRQRATGSATPAPGQTSDVETRFLRMSLDHDSGELGGIVLAGPLEGRRLNELELGDLLDLLATCRTEDHESAAVLEAYLDRIHGEAWRDRGGSSDGASLQRMSVDEARQILDVEARATRAEIITAHRRLMQKMHPDRDGSTFLAARINQARETLLGA